MDSAKKQLIGSLQSQIDSVQGGAASTCRPIVSPSNGKREKKAVQVADGLDSDKAYQKILRLLSYRDRSEAELRKKLRDAELSEKVIEEALGKAKRYGFVNDERFANTYAAWRLRSGRGALAVKRELKQKGFAEYEIEEVLENTGEMDSQYQRALEYALKHPTRSKNVREGVFRKLIGRGFSSSIASRVARDVSGQNDA